LAKDDKVEGGEQSASSSHTANLAKHYVVIMDNRNREVIAQFPANAIFDEQKPWGPPSADAIAGKEWQRLVNARFHWTNMILLLTYSKETEVHLSTIELQNGIDINRLELAIGSVNMPTRTRPATSQTIRNAWFKTNAVVGLASLYFYLGYYSGMRYSVNHMRSINLVPIGEPEGIRSIIERLPAEVAALRLGAEPGPAMIKVGKLTEDLPSKWWNPHVRSKSNE
jgi:hypothetical protein